MARDTLLIPSTKCQPSPALQSHFTRQLILKKNWPPSRGPIIQPPMFHAPQEPGLGGQRFQGTLASQRGWGTKHQHVYLHTNMLRISSLFLVDMKGSSSQLKRLSLIEFFTLDLKYSKCTPHSSDFLYFWELHTPPKYPHTQYYSSRKASTSPSPLLTKTKTNTPSSSRLPHHPTQHNHTTTHPPSTE